MKKNYTTQILNIVLGLLFIMLINGRSFLGIYIFGFRLGEIITGFAIFYIIFVILYFDYYQRYINKTSIILFLVLSIYFLIINLINSESFLNFYIYKSSVSIWFISFLFFGVFVFNNIEISNKYFLIGYGGLILQFIFNVIYYPRVLSDFFNNYSDKTQFLKGSEIAIFFIVITFFSNRKNKEGFMIDIFVIISSIYLPLMFFKSRAGGIAILIYFIIEIVNNRLYFMRNIKKSLILIFVSIIAFSTTSFYLLDWTVGIDKAHRAPAAVEQVIKHRYTVSNTYDDEVSFVFFREGRIYSADGNFNWRLQLWQDSIYFVLDEDKGFFGYGFGKKLPMFDTSWYAGEDGSNENTHNYFINFFTKAGLIGLTVLLLFFYFVFKQKKIEFSNSDLIIFLLPLFIISMFDGSMENPYFASVFYFFLSSFFTGIKFKREKQ